MAVRPPGRSPPLLRLLLLLMAVLAAGPGVEACMVDDCSRDFGGSVSVTDSHIPAAKRCAMLHEYKDCLHRTAKLCRGHLGFHSTFTIVRKNMERLGCYGQAPSPAPTAPRLLLPPSPPPQHHSSQQQQRGRQPPTSTPPPDPACLPKQPTERYRHCALFGDPHLKTFSNQYQTCRVQGAWPLIENANLAVQVTNEPVLEGSRATATTKVTVIVRAGSLPCASYRKTYEATSEAPLPATFIDGTQSSPGGNVHLRVYEDGDRVELTVRHLDALIVIRRTGRYLAFSARLPEALALAGGDSGLQLCAQGCPPKEQLHPQNDRGEVLQELEAELRCGSNLTGAYKDWCVFDVMTTGEDDFAEAAQAAQMDVQRLDPQSLRAPGPFDDQATYYGNSSAAPRTSVQEAALLLLMLTATSLLRALC